MRTRSLALSLGILTAAPALFGQAHLADSLRAAAPGETVPVFLLLKDQPQREIFQHEESAASFVLDATQRRLRAVSENGTAAEAASARAAAERAIADVRTRAFAMIEAKIQEDQSSVETLLTSLGARKVWRYKAVNMMTAEVRADRLEALAAHPAIAEILPAQTLRTQLASSVPGLGAPAFWSAGWNGTGQSVAIIDSGITANHPAFQGKTVVAQVFLTFGQENEQCFGDDPNSPVDQLGHGTHVAGIVGSLGSFGFENHKGVAPGASLYSLKAAYKGTGPCGGSGLADSRDIQAAIDWLVQNTPVRIANMSLGSQEATDDDALSRYMDSVADVFGVFFSIAAGNGTGCRIHTPGHAYNVMSIANYQTRGTIYSSCNGPTIGGRFKPDVAAPGFGIASTAWNWETGNDYLTLSGTSMAAPHIAGSAALLANGALTDPLAMRAALVNTTDNDGWAADRGWGYANLTTAQSQFTFGRTGQLAGGSSPGSFHLYELPGAGKAKASIAWNRHIVTQNSGVLNDIDLFTYSRDTGAAVTQSADPLQTVQQVVAASGPAVIKVRMITPVLAGGITLEKYGIAFNQAATLRGGPALVPVCTAPAEVATGSAFQLSCTVTNSGDLNAFSTGLTVSLSNGFTGSGTASFGTVNAGSASSSQNLPLTTPVTGGNFTLSYTATSTAFGETFTGVGTVVVNVIGPPGLPTNPVPADLGTALPGPRVLGWSAAPAATSYDVYFGTTAVPPLVTNVTVPGYTPPALAAATTYYWRVVAKNAFGSNSSPTWTFTTVQLTNLSLTTGLVTGGTSVTGTVTLSGPAPPFGAQVTLSSSAPAASVPPFVNVAAGATSANFTVNTSAVASATVATLTATFNGSAQAGLTINPPLPTPATVTFSANPVLGGTPVTGTVTLNVPAWPSNVTVNLSSSAGAATVPASVTIAAGAISANFPITTSTVTARTVANITATLNGTAQGALTLQMPASSLIGWWKLDDGSGTSAFDSSNSANNGTLVNAPAWSAGRVGEGLTLGGTNFVDAGNPAVLRNVTSITVAGWIKPTGTNDGTALLSLDSGSANFYSLNLKDGGSASLQGPSFQILTNQGARTLFSNRTGWNTTQWYFLAGSYDSATRTQKLYLDGALAASTVLPAGSAMLIGGYGTQTVSLGADAGVGYRGSIDDLRIYSAALSDAEIAALFTSAGGPPAVQISAVSLSTPSVTGGMGVTGTVTLSGPAPAGNAVVSVTSSNAAASVPPSVTVNAGATSANFTIGTAAVSSQQSAVITAGYNGSAQATVTVNPAAILSVSLSPGTVTGGASVSGTVTLNGPAPVGNAVVALTSTNTAAPVPVNVTVNAGSTTANFTINTTTVTSSQSATVTATFNGTAQASLTVNPAAAQVAVSSVLLSAPAVTGGTSVTGTVTLNGAAPSGNALVGLTSSNGSAAVPASVTVAAGATSADFTINTSPVASSQSATITAAYNGTAQAILTVNPAASGGTPTLVGWFRLDEGTGNVAGDSSGNGTAGLLTNAPSWIAGRTGQALDFHGGNWVDLGNPAVLRNLTSVTVSAWVKPGGTNGGQAIIAWDGGSWNFYSLNLNDAGSPALRGPSFSIAATTGYETVFFNKTDWDTSRWYLLSGSFDNTAKSLKLYVDGVPVASRTLSASAVMQLPGWGTQKVYVGSDAGSGVRAAIDDVRIYTGALSDAAVLGIFGGVPAPAPSVASVTVSPNPVTGGAAVTGTVTLTGTAPAGNAVVTLSSSNGAATVPPNVTVLAGATSATFNITTTTVASTQSATITATYNGTAQAPLTVNAPSGGGGSPTLVGWWKLDEGTGLTTADSSGNGSTGVLTGSPSWTAGRDGQGLTFNGGNQVDLGNPAVLRNLTSVSVSAWFKPSGTNGGQPLAVWDSGSANFYSLNINDSGSSALRGPSFTVMTTGGVETVFFNKTDWDPAQWYLLTGSFDNASKVMKIHVNGALAATRTLASGASMLLPSYGTQKVYIGGEPGWAARGVIDDVRIYSGALTDAAVAGIYGGAPPPPPSVATVGLTPSTVTGGTGVTGSVTLSGAAPAGGASVALSSSNGAAVVPANVTVLAGALTANFAITTNAVTSAQIANITATYNGSAQGTLSVNPPSGGGGSGPVGWWRLDEGSGSSSADSGSGGSPGTLVNAPSWTTGRSGQALQLNGTNWVDLGNTAPLRNLTSVTVSAWIKPGLANHYHPIAAWDSGSVNFYELTLKDSGYQPLQGPRFSIATPAGQESVFFNKIDWDPNQWYLVTGSFDNTAKALKVYVNGALVASRTLPAGTTMMLSGWGTQKAYLGGDPGDGFRGALDDARIYNRALSDTEVAALAQ